MVLPDLNVHNSNMEVLLGVMTHACHDNSWELRQGDYKFQAGLGYTVRPCLKK